MKSLNGFRQSKKRLADIYDIERSDIEKLRIILQEEYGREVSYKDAAQIAHGLTTYYRLLADGRVLLKGGANEAV